MTKLFSNKKFLKAGIIICSVALLAVYCVNLLALEGTELDPYSSIRGNVIATLFLAVLSAISAVVVLTINTHLLKSKKEHYIGLISIINIYLFIYALNLIFRYVNYRGILLAVFPLAIALLAHFFLKENSDYFNHFLYITSSLILIYIFNILLEYNWGDNNYLTDIVFMAVISLIPWVTSKRVKALWKMIVPIIIILCAFAVSAERVFEIFEGITTPLSNFNENSNLPVNWIGFRLEAAKAIFTGDLSFVHEYHFWAISRSCPLMWYICNGNIISAVLYSFFTTLQIILLLCFTTKAYKTEDAHPVLKTISATLLVSNIAGIFFDLLLFTSTGFGITPICNIFSFILLTLLVLMPEKLENIEEKAFFIGTYTKTAKKEKITVPVPLKFWNYITKDMWWYYVRDVDTPYDYLVICTPEVMEEMKKTDDLLEPLYIRRCDKLETGMFSIVLPDCLFGYEPEDYDVTFVGAGKHIEIWRNEDFFEYTSRADEEFNLKFDSILNPDIVSGLDLETLLNSDVDSLFNSDENTDADSEEMTAADENSEEDE